MNQFKICFNIILRSSSGFCRSVPALISGMYFCSLPYANLSNQNVSQVWKYFCWLQFSFQSRISTRAIRIAKQALLAAPRRAEPRGHVGPKGRTARTQMTSATTGRLVMHFKGWVKVALPIGASDFILVCFLELI